VRLVHEGGHHEVYCDGKDHYKIAGGGYTRLCEVEGLQAVFPCDCKFWNGPRETPWPLTPANA
jgi:hypothetical protein